MSHYPPPDPLELEAITLDQDPVTGIEFEQGMPDTMPSKGDLVRKKWILVGAWMRTAGLEHLLSSGKPKDDPDIVLQCRGVIARLAVDASGHVKLERSGAAPNRIERPVIELIVVP